MNHRNHPQQGGLIVDFPQHSHRAACDRPTLTLDHDRHPATAPRVVSFAEHVQIRSVEDLSRSEHRGELYLTSREMKLSKYRLASLLRTIKAETSMAQYAEANARDTSAFLGLEKYIAHETTRGGIRRERAAFLRVIEAEQRRQRVVGVWDPEAMARTSEAVSEQSRRRARIVALIHAEDDDGLTRWTKTPSTYTLHTT